MAYDRSYETDDSAIPQALRRFIHNRTSEAFGLGLLAAIAASSLALVSWSANDPALTLGLNHSSKNLLGYPGAAIAQQLLQVLGLGVIVLLSIPVAWAITCLRHERPHRPLAAVFFWAVATLCASAAVSLLPVPSTWALSAGLGGNAGDMSSGYILTLFAFVLKGIFPQIIAGLLFAYGAVWCTMRATGLTKSHTTGFGQHLYQQVKGMFAWLMTLGYQGFHKLRTARKIQQPAPQSRARAPRGDILTRLAPEPKAPPRGQRVEPVLSRTPRPQPPYEPACEPEEAYETAEYEADYPLEQDEPVYEDDVPFDLDDETAGNAFEPEMTEAEIASLVTRKHVDIKPGSKLKQESRLQLNPFKSPEFEFPPLTLLSEPKKTKQSADLSDDVLAKNARILEGVLEDFGVRGQIINVKPGPVVTLYELEPAPGIKSSRVISLADDIARSMSAISARVAVVQGRNVIGIELPNSKRETVYLREMLGSETFERTTQNLAFALGKNIGGEPIFADLAKMPHLLIAGTTGSGKSVGINTMILSLLYRLTPDQCKLIMIDPKMLELSVYEGIPHLLAPVVTDPRKAVVALKWAVREMEDRYRKMSKVGVRNIDGYNSRLKQSQAKGEQMSRTVQTGFDAETGQPIFEQEQMDMSHMPYIVVIIDEMADLMMVAGKDIEGAVQRLAQMARAAGIHVVMATQRPSVDVITGTIKANFPTRISFQVTSKIDSRTILGEMGAEQLLGQGDMLYMAGGGRISRLHGPFVADDEVEKIVSFLKAQGSPSYVDAVTEEIDEPAYGEPGAMGPDSGSGDDLYDQAVAVVLRDKKVSTSYVQRRLQVGYNKAASLIERMEKEGLISAANATGKREILVPGDSARD